MPALAQEPQVTISPASGPPGTTVTAEGFGFTPGEELALIFGEETLTAGAVDEEGFARLTGSIPETFEPGLHPIHVQRADGSRITQPFEVTAPEESPTAAPGAVVPGQPGSTETGDESPQRERRASAADEEDGGVPWWVWVLVAALIAAGLGALIGASTRRGEGRSQYADRCPAIKRVRTSAGVRFVAEEEPRLVSQSPGCTWFQMMRRIARSYDALHQCTLQRDHAGDHVFEETPSGREPASPDQFFEELPGEYVGTSIEDPNCGMAGNKDEIRARVLTRYNQREFAGAGGEGIPPPLPPGVCHFCKQPRVKSPCEHCQMGGGWTPAPESGTTPLPR